MGLNDDPGCRQAWKARLNSLYSKSYPPIIASTYPLFGSMLIIAPCSLGSCSSEYIGTFDLSFSSVLSARTRTTSPGAMTPRRLFTFTYSEFSSGLGFRAHQAVAMG